MDIITIDFETYFDKDYTLRKMATSLYVKDDRFKVISMGIKINDEPTRVFTTESDICDYLYDIDWNDSALLCHHTQFDGLILAHHYQIIPAFYLDTMSMGRAKHSTRSGAGLDALCAFLDMPRKSDDVDFAKGKAVLTEEELARMVEYNKNDVDITYDLYHKLLPYPQAELDLIDLTVRMFTQPGFEIDIPRAQKEYEREIGEKTRRMMLAGLTRETLSKDKLFAKWLDEHEVLPPQKWSAKQGKTVYAFAKTDLAFTNLLEHENELVRFAVEARLSIKSTGNETRAQRFVTEGALGPLPVYLAYYGAHTGRWSGGNKINLQNLKRGGELRKCLIAPAGYVIGVADSGQIECRVNGWLSGQRDLLERFKLYDMGDKANDPYRVMASTAYHIPVNEVDSSKRFIGKIAVLGLGFQMGGPKFQGTLASGAMGPKTDISLNESYDIVNIYRKNNPKIVEMWERCEGILNELWQGIPGEYGCISWRNSKIYLPNGMYLEYPDIQMYYDSDTGIYSNKSCQMPNFRKNIYGGIVLENCLAAGTLVLTNKGWIPIEDIKDFHLVHDGEKFVQHGGKVFKSVQPCVIVDGVYMTPDHEVLTNEGWKPALEKPKPYRPSIRNAYCNTTKPLRWKKNALAISMQMRQTDNKKRNRRYEGSQTRRNAQLRMFNEATNLRKKYPSWYEHASSVLGLAKYDRSMPITHTSIVAKLRRSWSTGMRRVAEEFRKLLGRHGNYISKGVGFGPREQQRPLLSRELPMDLPKNEYTKQTEFARPRHDGAIQKIKGTEINSVLPMEPRPVYDILNAGSKQRFVVLGENGPFIVHNCVQALARIIVAEQMVAISKRYKVLTMTHDEVVCLIPEDEAEEGFKYMFQCMTTAPAWCSDLPLMAEGGTAREYSK